MDLRSSFPWPLLGAAALALLGALGGCQSTLQNSDSFLGVDHAVPVEIVQGNVITDEQAALSSPA
jgi:hypothetical protein